MSIASGELKDRINNRVGIWSQHIQEAKAASDRKQWLSFLIGGLVPIAVSAVLFFATSLGGIILAVGVVAGLVGWVYMGVQWAGKSAQQAGQTVADTIRKDCADHDIPKNEAVEALVNRVPVSGMRKTILDAIDPEAAIVVGIRERGEQALRGSVSEANILTFRDITLQCVEHQLYVEAVAALGVVSAGYAELAPPFPPGVDVDSMIKFTFDVNQKIQLARRKVWSNFEFQADIKAIADAGNRRRQSSLLKLLMASMSEQQDSAAALAEAAQELKPLVRDPEFVGRCVDFLGKRCTQQIQALQSLVLIPDKRILPYLMGALDILPFYPQGIEALLRLGDEAHADLLDLLRAGNSNRRFNISLALGAMNVEAARPVVTEILETTAAPIERTGLLYVLVKLGDADRMGEIAAFLPNPNQDISHAAAIALEHLDNPLADDVYLQHLDHANELVRLRLTRKLGSQKTDNPALIDALVQRLGDANESVREAAVESLAKRGTELVYDRMVTLAQNDGAKRSAAYQVLGKLENSQAEPLLIQALERYSATDQRKAVIGALADLQSVQAVPKISPYLKNDQLSGAAMWALLRIGFKEPDRVIKIFDSHSDALQRMFVQAVLGNEKAVGQLRSQLTSVTEISKLLQALEYARILSKPEYEKNLRALLNYSNQQYQPTDKFIPYMAFKALIHTLLAKN